MHIEKYKGCQMGAVLSHINRNNNNYSNKNIDKTRTKENYSYTFDEEEKDYRGMPYIQERLSQIEIAPNHKQDAVRLVGLVVTLPEELKGKDIDIQKDFFSATAAAIAERYGCDNIAYATVHFDEVTPHLHAGIIPIVMRDGKEKLCAKDMFDRKELQRLHPELELRIKEYMKHMKHEIEFSLQNGKTHTKNVRELKTKDLEAYKSDLARLRKENRELQQENTRLKRKSEREKSPEIDDFER